jgi:hypothetical protein
MHVNYEHFNTVTIYILTFMSIKKNHSVCNFMHCKIGILKRNLGEAVVNSAIEQINRIGLNIEGKVLFENSNNLLQAIAMDEVQIGIGHLSEFPVFSESDDIVVTALSGRTSYGYKIISYLHEAQEGDCKVHSGNETLIVSDRLQYEQLQQIFEKANLRIENLGENEILELIIQDKQIEMVVDQDVDVASKKPEGKIISKALHPTELTGKPGMGVLAYLTHKESFGFRKALKKLHNPVLMRESNVERTVQKLMGSDMISKLGVYCYMDPKRHYRVTAVALDPYRRVNISQSTFIGLGEKVADLLKNNNE